MSILQIALASAVVCGSTTCSYHNDEFGYSAVFPKSEETTVCAPEDPHGTRLLLRRGADCESFEEPGIGIGVYYNALYWANSEVAARALCRNGIVVPTKLKIDGLPVTECRGSDDQVKGWSDENYIAVDGASREDGGLILMVELDAPPGDISKYEGTLLQFLKTIKLPHFSAGSHGH